MTVPSLAVNVDDEPALFEFRQGPQELFRIISLENGKIDIVLGEGVTWTEAAEGFWKIVKDMRP